MKSVALVGFASATREGVRESRAEEVWGLNMLHSSPLMRQVFPLNITRLFELHPRWMLQKDWYCHNVDHWRWLTKVRHHYPVMLIEAYPEIHNGRKYPLEEITARYLGRIKRNDAVVRYYTSSFCYMIAQALYEGFERIEVYGYEMGSETEYVYQKAGAEFWLGVASQYADIILPEKAGLLKAKLYGFEAGQLIERERIMDYRAWYESAYDAATVPETKNAWIEAQLINGAITLCDEMLGKGDTVSRQLLEGYKDKFEAAAHKLAAEVNVLNARFIEQHKASGDGDGMFRQAFERMKYMYRYDGATQLTRKLIAECDLQEPDKALVNRFKWQGFSEVGK